MGQELKVRPISFDQAPRDGYGNQAAFLAKRLGGRGPASRHVTRVLGGAGSLTFIRRESACFEAVPPEVAKNKPVPGMCHGTGVGQGSGCLE